MNFSINVTSVVFAMTTLTSTASCVEQVSAKSAPSERNHSITFDWQELTGTLPRTGERRNLEFRQRGLVIWGKFPHDPRRYDWLIAAVSQFVPRYAANTAESDTALSASDWQTYYTLPVDTSKKAVWEATYAKLRSDCLKDRSISDKYRERLLRGELEGYIAEQRIRHKYNEELIDLPAIQKRILEHAKRFPTDSWFIVTVNSILASPLDYGIRDSQEVSRFLAPFNDSPNRYLVKYTIGQEHVAKLSRVPLDLSFISMEGQQIDLKNYRKSNDVESQHLGKVVLIDIWSTSCTTCIQELPKIKGQYDKYRDRGLEVVGICVDIEQNRQKAKQILLEKHIEWPIWFTGGDNYTKGPTREFLERFSIEAVPIIWILGRDGKLIAINITGKRLGDALAKIFGTATA